MSQQSVIKINWSDFVHWRSAPEWTDVDSPGVYEFWVSLKGGGKRRIYVGKTDNLGKRLREHIRDDEPNKCLKKKLKKYVWYYRSAVIENRANREDTELWLYRHHEYECNEVEPAGSGRPRFIVWENAE